MMRTRRFVQPRGEVALRRPDGSTIEIPVVQGILKHLGVQDLARLLADPHVALKYTVEALRIAPWPVLRLFPRAWLLECLPMAGLSDRRARAVAFMLAARDPAA